MSNNQDLKFHLIQSIGSICSLSSVILQKPIKPDLSELLLLSLMTREKIMDEIKAEQTSFTADSLTSQHRCM